MLSAVKNRVHSACTALGQSVTNTNKNLANSWLGRKVTAVKGEFQNNTHLRVGTAVALTVASAVAARYMLQNVDFSSYNFSFGNPEAANSATDSVNSAAGQTPVVNGTAAFEAAVNASSVTNSTTV